MFAILKKRSFFLCLALLLSLAMPSVVARGDARADKIEAALAAQVEAWNAGIWIGSWMAISIVRT